MIKHVKHNFSGHLIFATAVLFLMAIPTGCTQVQLARSTLRQGGTITDLQYQMIMDNLGAFASNSESLAWHMKLTGGLVQVADQANGSLTAELFNGINSVSPLLGAQRGVVGQWNTQPATDPDELELLNLAYRRAVCPSDPAVHRELLQQICKTSVLNNIPLSEKIIMSLLPQLIAESGELSKIKSDFIVLYRTHEELKLQGNDSPAKGGDTESARDIGRRYKKSLLEKINKALSDERLRVGAEDPRDIGFRRFGDEYDSPFLSAIEQLATLDARETEQRIVEMTRVKLVPDIPYIPKYPLTSRAERNIAVVSQYQDKIEALVELASLEENADKKPFSLAWVNFGNQVPKNACYFGGSKNCYAWISAENLPMLKRFALIILSLAPTDKQDIITSTGPAFSPSLK